MQIVAGHASFTLIAIVCVPLQVPLQVPAQQQASKPGLAEQGVPRGRELRSVSHPVHQLANKEPVGTTHSWNSPTRWNARVKVTSLHSSKTGWATVAAPAAGHRFNNTFSAEASIPIYLYRLADSRLPNPPRGATLVEQQCELGDLVFSGHARFRSEHAHYQLTGSFSTPTGDETYGLSTGRVTFDLTSHAQRSFGRFTPTLTAGAGDSTTLANRLVTKTSTSLGPLAHFRAGVAIQLTPRISFEPEAIEQMPIGDQKTYMTSTEETRTTSVVTGRNVSERNGLNIVFDAVIDRHTIFSSYYSHSTRPGGDSISAGFTYSLRSSLPGKDISRDDLFR